MSDPYGGSTVREWDWVRLVSPHCAIDAGKAWRPAPLSENGIGFVWYSEVCYVRDQEHRRQRPAAVPVGLGSFGKFAMRDWRVKKLSVWVKASYPSSRLHHEAVAVWRNCFVISKNYVVNGARAAGQNHYHSG